MKLRILGLICLTVVCSFAATGMGAIVYPNVSGTDLTFTNITEDSVTDTPPLFGPPTLIGDTLVFFPTRFASEAANGEADTTAGTLSMRVNALNGMFVSQVRVTEVGDWMLTGTGSASVNVAGLLTVTDLDTAQIFTAPLTVSPSGPFSLPNNSGEFRADAVVNLPLDPATGIGTTSAQIVFNNNLQSVAGPGTAAFIQKKVISGPGVIILIPEPATMSVLALGGLMALLRRRQK